MSLDELPPADQQLREERQIRDAVLVDLAEARHHVEKQEQLTSAPAAMRIIGYRGVEGALADRLELRLIGDIARERGRDVARLPRRTVAT